MKLDALIRVRTGKLDANAAVIDGQYPFFTCSRDNLRINNYAFDCECVLLAGNGELNAKYYNGKFNAYQRTYVIESLDKNKLSVKFLYYFFSWYLDVLRQKSIGGVIKYIKLGNITQADLKIPSLHDQNKIVDVFDKLSLAISNNKVEYGLLDKLIKSRFMCQEAIWNTYC